MALDIKRMVPVYYQIFDEIYQEIQDGHYQEGDQLPSESELMTRYKVSRGTIREAIKMLLHQGFVVRERGKGTFVTYKKIEQDAHNLMGFTELMTNNDKAATAKILEVTTKIPSKRIRKLLNLEEDEKVTKIQRLRFGDEEPLIIERSYFVYRIFKHLLNYDLENESIFDLLYQKTDYRLGFAQQSIEAVVAGPAEKKLLNVDVGSPLLLMKRLITLKDGSFFQYSEDIYRSDKLKFTSKTLMYDETHKNFDMSLGLTTNQM